jgi:hypothetical protein
MSDERSTRRDFIRRTAYAAPAILTLPAVLSIASAGSGSSGGGGGNGGGGGGGTLTTASSTSGGDGGRRGSDDCDQWYHIWFCFPF